MRGKDGRQEEKGTTENEMVGYNHGLKGHDFYQAPGERRGQKPGVLQSMGSQRVRDDLATEQQQQWGGEQRPTGLSVGTGPSGGKE